MARGLLVRLSTQDGSDITVEAVREAAAEQGQRLSELETLKFVPGAVAAAKALVDAVGVGPFFVTFSAVDSFGVHGEATVISVSVDSAATDIPSAAPITEVTSSSTEVAPTVGPDVVSQADEPASVETPESEPDEPETPESTEGEADGETVVEGSQGPPSE